MTSDDLGDRPAPHANTAAGLATNPGNVEQFREVLATNDGAGRIAFASAVKALEAVSTSIVDMAEAHRLMQSTLPEHRQMGVDGKIRYVVPEADKLKTADAMSQSFRRGSKQLEDASRIIDEAAAQVEGRINASLTNNRRNETSVAAVAVQIRDLVKNMPAVDRIGFVRQAALDHDLEIVSAVFGASPFISGLTRQQLADLKADAELAFAPDAVKARTALSGMRAKLETAGGFYLSKYSELVPRASIVAAKGEAALAKLRTGTGA